MGKGTALEFDDLQELLWSFATHRVLIAGGRSGLLRALSSGAATSEELAADLGLDPLATAKVVRALCALGLVVANGERYEVTEALRDCFAEGEGDLVPFLEHSHSMYLGWGEHLEGWLRGEGWPSRPRDREAILRFGRAMRAIGSHTGRRLAVALDLGSTRTLLDVGGGFGHVARALCRANPGLEATVLDLPEVVELALAEEGDPTLGGRVRWVAGDYLESDYGSGFDLVQIVSVLHQERPAEAAEVVRRAAAALAPGGRLAIVDFAIDEARRERLFGALFAVNMRSFGDTHTLGSIRSWMEAAGLERVERTDLDRHRWLIVGHRH